MHYMPSLADESTMSSALDHADSKGQQRNLCSRIGIGQQSPDAFPGSGYGQARHASAAPNPCVVCSRLPTASYTGNAHPVRLTSGP